MTIEAPPEHPHEGQARLFVTLWVMAFSAHYFENRPPDAWPVLLAGIPCLLFPGSPWAFGAFVLVGTGVAAMHLPAASNHLMLALLVHLVLMGALGIVMLGKRKPSSRELLPAWIGRAIVPATAVLLVVYFFGVFHKLNSSFFNPDVSCSGHLLYQGLKLMGLTVRSIPPDLIFLSAVLTLIIEALILFLIALPRTRRWGVVIGVSFHSLLSLALFYDFSSYVFALFVLVLPAESASLVPNRERWRRLGIAGWVLFGLVSLGAFVSEERLSPIGLTWHALQVAAWALAVGPIIVPLIRANFPVTLNPWKWSMRPAWLLVFPVLAFVNGMMPYLGFKTVASYSMFSNLRTEAGAGNHFLGPIESLQMTGTLEDTVDVFEIALPDDPPDYRPARYGSYYWFKRQMRWAAQTDTVRIPWQELRRAALQLKNSGIHGVSVSYSHDGQMRRVPDMAADPELTAPLPFLSRQLLAFREIEPGTRPVLCRW